MSNDFHQIALTSILFKGRNDIYFCYLKSEKIAHVLAVLTQNSSLKDKSTLEELVTLAGRLPHSILHFVAGEFDAAAVLADLLSILSSVRLAGTQALIRKENVVVIAQEYETIVRKIAAENHPSPFVAAQDFSIEEIKNSLSPKDPFSNTFFAIQNGEQKQKTIKDIDKADKGQQKEGSKRTSLILDFVRQNKGVSIKQIAAVVRDCSEKTIQRELTNLIEKGLIERKGERRWSVYIARPATP